MGWQASGGLAIGGGDRALEVDSGAGCAQRARFFSF